MDLIMQILGGILIVGTAISFFNHKVWWIRVFDFPRIQIATLSFIIVIYFVIRLPHFKWINTIYLLLLIITFFIQAYHIFRYLNIFSVDLKSEKNPQTPAISLLICNVLMTNRRTKKLFQLIEKYNPDIICLVETDHWWHKKLQMLKEKYPYFSEEPRDNTYGMHLYSALPLDKVDVKYLIDKEVPSIHTQFSLQDKLIKASLIHPKPPAPSEAWTSKKRDQEILYMAKEIRDSEHPWILMGDLNDVAWSDTTRHFRRYSKMLDPRRGRGFFNTFHAKYPLMRWPLDHVFVTPHFKLGRMKRLPKMGSDHFPIFVRFCLPD